MRLEEGLAKALSSRWIAGEYLEDAVALTKRFNSRGVQGLMSSMGRGVTERQKIVDAVGAFKKLIAAIKENDLDAEITMMPSQLGLFTDTMVMSLYYKNIVESAKANHIFVWLDMEHEEYVDHVIRLYMERIKSGNTGIALQSYLKRSNSDLERLVKAGAAIRLVKGAYMDQERDFTKIYRKRKEIDANFVEMMTYLFKYSKRKFVIGTHDQQIIDLAKDLAKKYHSKLLVFGMLNGMRNAYAVKLAQEGYRVQVYVSYGTRWIEYGWERLLAGKNYKMVLRSLREDQTI